MQQKLVAALILFSGLLYSQVTLTVNGPSTVSQGTSVNLTVTLAGSSGQNLASLQWTVAPLAGVTWGTPTISSGAAALGKGVYSNPANGVSVVTGMTNATPPVISNTAFTDGAVATIPATFKPASLGAVSIPLSSLLGASLTATSITVASGTVYSITVTPSPCSYLGNDTVTYADATAMVSAIIGLTACSSSFTFGCSLDTLQAVLIYAQTGVCSL